ncbi:hypothetical protein C7S15_1585 [Burkholderia cepacia]|nr:hypothetical protein [Burkholderia cepacia]
MRLRPARPACVPRIIAATRRAPPPHMTTRRFGEHGERDEATREIPAAGRAASACRRQTNACGAAPSAATRRTAGTRSGRTTARPMAIRARE